MASKRYNDLERMQRCKGKVVPRVKNKKVYRALQEVRREMKANIKKADQRSLADKSKPVVSGYLNNVWGF